jgi:hypothetical protein
MTQIDIGARYLRSGFWLLLLGLLMSFGMVLHYVVGARYPTNGKFLENITLWYACPWTLSTAVVFGGALGMIAIGSVYLIFGKHAQMAGIVGMERAALALCTTALIAMFMAGFVGYFVVDAIWPAFYYRPVLAGKNVWLLLQLCCMILYAAGVLIAFNGIRRTSFTLAPQEYTGSPGSG